MSDKDAVAAIKNGDEKAISHIMEKYSRLVWTIVSAVLKNTSSVQDIEECVADVFIYLWNHPEKYDPSRGTLKTWLTVMARSSAIDRYRRINRHIELPLDERLLSGELELIDGIITSELSEQLNSAISGLPEQDRDILIRRYYYDQKPREIAFALNIPVKRVENRLYKTKLKLRELMTD